MGMLQISFYTLCPDYICDSVLLSVILFLVPLNLCHNSC